MRRLFSIFADRSPSLGLLLLRIVVGSVLILRFVQLYRWTPLQTTALYVIAAGAGLLLLLGSWTVVSGVAVGLIEIFLAVSHRGEPFVSVLLAALGLALALLGAGAWSLDAWRFGWRRIEIRRPD